MVNDRLRRQAFGQQFITPGRYIDRANGGQEQRPEPRRRRLQVGLAAMRALARQHSYRVSLGHLRERGLACVIPQHGGIAALQFALDFARPNLGIGQKVKRPTDRRHTLTPNLCPPPVFALLKEGHDSP
jgi:hypothetical protein